MLRDQIRQIVQMNPDWASITPVIEKEILHHDIFSVMVESGVMDRLTFIGGTPPSALLQQFPSLRGS
jgi:hypothetical protein